MKDHLAYARYVLRHKWHVLRACRSVGLPLRVGLVHDLSKFLPREWSAYVHAFYDRDGKSRYEDSEAFSHAWNAHQKSNPHHWEYWLLDGDKPLRMPERYTREMVADWIGAGLAITGKKEVAVWYVKNYHRMKLHPATRRLVDQILCEHGLDLASIPPAPLDEPRHGYDDKSMAQCKECSQQTEFPHTWRQCFYVLLQQLRDATVQVEEYEQECNRLQGLLKAAPEAVRLHFEQMSNEFNLGMTHPVIAIIAESMSQFLEDAGAKNYIECRFKHENGFLYLVTLHRPDGLTPDQLRRSAERERDEYKGAIEDLLKLTTDEADSPRLQEGDAKRASDAIRTLQAEYARVCGELFTLRHGSAEQTPKPDAGPGIMIGEDGKFQVQSTGQWVDIHSLLSAWEKFGKAYRLWRKSGCKKPQFDRMVDAYCEIPCVESSWLNDKTTGDGTSK